MNQFVDEFSRVERELAKQEGEFALFALFLREEGIGKWDLVVAATWAGSDEWRTINVVADAVKRLVAPSRMLTLSRIVPVDPGSAEVAEINRDYPVRNDAIEVKNATFFGMPMKHAYILASAAADVPAVV